MKNLKKDEENIEELETVKKLYEKLLDYENYDRSVFMKKIRNHLINIRKIFKIIFKIFKKVSKILC